MYARTQGDTDRKRDLWALEVHAHIAKGWTFILMGGSRVFIVVECRLLNLMERGVRLTVISNAGSREGALYDKGYSM